ncbi:glycoside hydrolase family 127 protein [Thalassotalea mangrovi]|uniref:Glycosyl hydrolase n=1 Tax=Thalassotalea mangrovi TaxID=2572245 RepID=A0A4U1B2K3_9GAMM|nr:glycoside hydrolase family 127 protein [Thalassotalea mangrovi]TKB43818.1 glycosyl hydrolase [Thalassotalea mangrovi]
MKKLVLKVLLFVAFSYSSISVGTPLQAIPLTDVRITDGPFLHAQQTNLSYLLAMDPERLLAPYRREANLPVNTESYPNWENTGLDGHIGGHYLTALSLMYASTGDKEVLARLNYMVAELAKCQQQHGNGYLGAVPDGTRIWKEIAAGNIQADLFTLNQSWVPWYNLHKVFSGLRDAYLYTDNQQAKTMLIEFSDWMLALSNKLNDQQLQTMLRTEYGGLNETLADVYQITGEQKYLTLARRYTDMSLLTPLLAQQDKLNGLHANTQIPKIVGVARIASLANDHSWLASADYFWQQVVTKRSVSIGGNSVREHFHPSEDFSSMVKDVEGPETCNTYNMLKLSKLLYQQKGELNYLDYYERALFNHILSSQHPVHGGLVYFTPMRPNHYRMYSAVSEGMWCCVGSGIENHSKYGEMIYSAGDNQFYINLFIDSQVNWAAKNIRFSQTTAFPDSDSSKIVIHDSGKFALNIRYPAWVNHNIELSVNGKPVAISARPGQYITLDREWQAGDEINVRVPMQTTLEQLPDQSNYYSILHGPIVLAAKTLPFANETLNFIADSSRMGHIAQGPLCDLTEAPLFISDGDSFLQHIKRTDSEKLRFSTTDASMNQSAPLELIPFFRLHDSRYTLYFPQVNGKDWQAQKQQLQLVAQREKALAENTLDVIAPGQQQPEADHFFEGQNSEAGINGRRHWRHAHDWFSYRLNTKGETNPVLRLTYFGLDKDRRFDILIDNKLLTSVSLSGDKGATFYSVDYPIPSHLLPTDSHYLRITFKAHKDSIAGGLYGIRLLKH